MRVPPSQAFEATRDGSAGVAGGVARGGLRARGGGQAQRERGALAGAALDGEAAAEGGGQLAADGQAQAGALAASLGGVEGLEDARRVLGADAHAVVADLE